MNQENLLDPNLYKVISKCFVNKKQPDIKTQTVVTVEDNVLLGGFGNSVALWASQNDGRYAVKCFAYEDKFITHGGVSQLQKMYGVDPVAIENFIDGKTV